VGITQFQVRRSLLDPIGYQVLVEVRNFSDKPAEVQLEMELDGTIVDVIPLELEPEQEWSDVFEKVSETGGQLVASLDRADALRSDNVARAILPERKRQQVVLVTEGHLFLQRVFEANALVDLTVSDSVPARLPADAILVLHRSVPNPLPKGKLIVIEPTASTGLWETAGPLEYPAVAEQDEDSELMAHVKLGNVLMPEARKLIVNGEPEVLAATAEGDPLYFFVRRESGNVLVLTVNLDRGDLPLRTAFPILMSNALGWFAGVKGELRESLATGTVARVELPESLRGDDETETVTLELQSPQGEFAALPVSGSEATIGPLDRCGIWRISEKRTDGEQAGGETVQVACNLSSPEESDLRRPKDLQQSQPDRLAAGFGGRPIWFYLIALAWLLTATEWYLYQRRWIQ
ncbi:MAG: hypothetical protein ACREIV_11160, partial [Planctomycetaceae bacterium]